MRSPNARLRWTDAGEAALSNEGLEKEVALIILRSIATLLSGPCVLIGAIWILQGVNVLPGSFMTGDRLVLIDTGLGPLAANQLVASLKIAGFEPGQVTDILITHSHSDHVFGLTTSAKALTFPNATVRMTTKEWAWMKSLPQNAALAALIEAKVKTFEPGAELAPGVTAVALDGHTPGHSGYEVRSGKASLLDLGDMVHSSVVSLAKPEWSMGFDSDKALSKATRRAELTALAKSGSLVFTPHFPFPGVGHVVAQGDGFVWKPGVE